MGRPILGKIWMMGVGGKVQFGKSWATWKMDEPKTIWERIESKWIYPRNLIKMYRMDMDQHKKFQKIN